MFIYKIITDDLDKQYLPVQFPGRESYGPQNLLCLLSAKASNPQVLGEPRKIQNNN